MYTVPTRERDSEFYEGPEITQKLKKGNEKNYEQKRLIFRGFLGITLVLPGSLITYR